MASVAKVLPQSVKDSSYAVLYLRASDQFDAIKAANEWAIANDMERARELTLGRLRDESGDYYIARCYRRLEGER